jgi:hypothetical protein
MLVFKQIDRLLLDVILLLSFGLYVWRPEGQSTTKNDNGRKPDYLFRDNPITVGSLSQNNITGLDQDYFTELEHWPKAALLHKTSTPHSENDNMTFLHAKIPFSQTSV